MPYEEPDYTQQSQADSNQNSGNQNPDNGIIQFKIVDGFQQPLYLRRILCAADTRRSILCLLICHGGSFPIQIPALFGSSGITGCQHWNADYAITCGLGAPGAVEKNAEQGLLVVATEEYTVHTFRARDGTEEGAVCVEDIG